MRRIPRASDVLEELRGGEVERRAWPRLASRWDRLLGHGPRATRRRWARRTPKGRPRRAHGTAVLPTRSRPPGPRASPGSDSPAPPSSSVRRARPRPRYASPSRSRWGGTSPVVQYLELPRGRPRQRRVQYEVPLRPAPIARQLRDSIRRR